MNLFELANASMMHGVPPSQIVAAIKESVNTQKHEQKLSTLERSLGDYPLALSALNFAKLYHTGTRNDGVTPEFDHQVSIVRFILKLAPYLMHPDETLAVGFLHDISEDYSIPFAEIAKKFNTKISRGVNLVTKKFDGVSRREDKLFQLMAQHPVASIVKGVDRIHNQSTMDPFTDTKKGEYLDFTDGNIIPMLLDAKNNFPTQADAYDMILRVLGYQEKTYRADESTLTYDEYVGAGDWYWDITYISKSAPQSPAYNKETGMIFPSAYTKDDAFRAAKRAHRNWKILTVTPNSPVLTHQELHGTPAKNS